MGEVLRLTEGQPGRFFLDAFLLGAVRGVDQPIGELKECELLLFLHIETTVHHRA
jgi:hypothetical protein